MIEPAHFSDDLTAASVDAERRCRELETALAESQAALHASEARYRVFVDYTSDGLFLHGRGGRVVDVNRRACESLGYQRDELIGLTAPDFDSNVSPADVERIRERLGAGEVVCFDSRHRRKDGSEFPVEVRIRPVWLDGQLYALALACDITERKRVEEALRRSESQLAEAQRLAHIGSWNWDIKTSNCKRLNAIIDSTRYWKLILS